MHTKDLATLLQNFSSYVNPDGKLDPWFSLLEINQHFAEEDVDALKLLAMLEELQRENLVVLNAYGEWRWNS